MPVPAEDMTFRDGNLNSVSTQQRTVGWPADAENDPYTEPMSIVSMLTGNPYPPEDVQ